MNVKSGSRMDLLLCSWLLPCHRWLSYLAADYVTLQLTTLHCSWLLLCRWLSYLEANCYFAAAYVTLHLNVLPWSYSNCYLAADCVTLHLTMLPWSWLLTCSWLLPWSYCYLTADCYLAADWMPTPHDLEQADQPDQGLQAPSTGSALSASISKHSPSRHLVKCVPSKSLFLHRGIRYN